MRSSGAINRWRNAVVRLVPVTFSTTFPSKIVLTLLYCTPVARIEQEWAVAHEVEDVVVGERPVEVAQDEVVEGVAVDRGSRVIALGRDAARVREQLAQRDALGVGKGGHVLGERIIQGDLAFSTRSSTSALTKVFVMLAMAKGTWGSSGAPVFASAPLTTIV